MKIRGVGKHSELVHTARYIKSIAYGGMDGIITTFAIVAGVAGASLSASIVLILGFANLIADGISMAAGDYLSTKDEMSSHKNKGLFKKITRKRLLINDKERSPLKNAIVTFISFIIFGFIPLLAYVLQSVGFKLDNVFLISIILTGLALILLGIFKCKITGKNWLKSVMETLLIGGIAAGAAYYIGYLISSLV